MAYTTYKTREVFDVRPDFKDPLHSSLDDFAFEQDAAGLAIPWKPTSKLKRSITLPYLIEGADQLAVVRGFFNEMGGRRLAFWVPAWAHELYLATDHSLGASSLTIRDSNFGERFALGNQNKHIAIVTRSTFDCYGVSAVTPSGANEVLTLDTNLVRALTAKDTIAMPLLLCRLTHDDLEWLYENEDVARLRLDFTECPTEAPPALPGTLAPVTGERPVWLYKIEAGGTVYRYANYGVLFTDANSTPWTAAHIVHSGMRHGLDALGEEMEVTVRTDLTAHVLRQFVDRYNVQPITVSVYLTDADAKAVSESAPFHTGRVERLQFDSGGDIVLTVSSLFRAGERQVPGVLVSRICHHATFDTLCGLVESDWRTSGTISAVNAGPPPYVEASAFGTKATAEGDDDWFALGKVTVGNEVRLCVGVEPLNLNRLYLNAPFKAASVGNSVTATAGDDRRVETCKNKFDNQANFLGFPYLPNQNPQFQALQTPTPKAGKK